MLLNEIKDKYIINEITIRDKDSNIKKSYGYINEISSYQLNKIVVSYTHALVFNIIYIVVMKKKKTTLTLRSSFLLYAHAYYIISLLYTLKIFFLLLF